MATKLINIDRDIVIKRASMLPSFPAIVQVILSTIEDPNANFNLLVEWVKREPVLMARVFDTAKSVTKMSEYPTILHETKINIYQAISLIGIERLRELVAIGGVANFVKSFSTFNIPETFLEHAICVGICSEELSQHLDLKIPAETALITGMMHDVGQLWLYHFYSEEFRNAWQESIDCNVDINEIEREYFGVSHAEIGGWLAENWSLPTDLCAAISFHHSSVFSSHDNSLAPLIHVAEVLSNALDLANRDKNRVLKISTSACSQLGLLLDENIIPLFGRIEARSKNVRLHTV